MGMQRVGDLEINQDLEFERRSWRVQRFAWGLISLILLAALLGLLGGGGPLSARTIGEGSSLSIRFEPYARHNSPAELAFTLAGLGGGEARISLGAEYLEAVRIERIEPEPREALLGADGITYVFTTDGAAASTIVFFIMPETVGIHAIRAGVEGGEEYHFTQVIYP